MKAEPKLKKAGPTRFQARTHPTLYRVAKALRENTYKLADLNDPKGKLPFVSQVHADRLIRMELDSDVGGAKGG